MDYDLVLVIGIIVAGLSFPSLLNAFSTGRPPRVATMLIAVGGGMIAFAATQSPAGYTIDGVPKVFVRVIADIIR